MCQKLHFEPPNSVSWTEVYFWIPNVLSYPSNSAKSNTQGFHDLDLQPLSLTTDPVFLWPCSTVQTEPSLFLSVHLHSTTTPSISFSPLLSQQWEASTEERENAQNPPLLTRTKLNCVRVQSLVVALAWNHCPWFLPRRVSAGEL